MTQLPASAYERFLEPHDALLRRNFPAQSRLNPVWGQMRKQPDRLARFGRRLGTVPIPLYTATRHSGHADDNIGTADDYVCINNADACQNTERQSH